MPWVFGYGSLIWRPGFDYLERRAALVVGYRRRFWQGSTDHRGVPGSPGRVVTLLAQGGSHCWGAAYRISEDAQPHIHAELDHREKGGYARLDEPIYAALGETAFARALVYVATPDNPNYLGCAPLADIAAQVKRSSGPSGSNVEYVLELARALRELGADDSHVFRLERLLRRAD